MTKRTKQELATQRLLRLLDLSIAIAFILIGLCGLLVSVKAHGVAEYIISFLFIIVGIAGFATTIRNFPK